MFVCVNCRLSLSSPPACDSLREHVTPFGSLVLFSQLYVLCVFIMNSTVPVKRHRGEPGHTRDTRTHRGTRTAQTNLTTIQTHQQHTTRTSARRPTSCGPLPRPTQEPQARSRPPPRPTQKRPPPANPTLPPPAPRAPPRACSKAVGETVPVGMNVCCGWVWMVVRFVCVVRVPLCVRVSRVCPGGRYEYEVSA
jgi:hypothetical protein